MKRIELKITSLSLLFSVMLNIRAQNRCDINLSYQYGLNLNNASERQFGNTIPSGVELKFHKQRTGDEYWEKLFNYPQTGWSLSCINHNNIFLGSTVALNRYLNYVFYRRRYAEIYVKLSQGIMYATKFYKSNDHANVRYNSAISQRVNFSEEIGLGISFFPTRRAVLNFGVIGIHFSNGAMSQPNDGLNLLMFNCGAAYTFGDREKIKFKQNDTEESDKSIKYNLYLGSGFKQIDNTNEEKYRLFSVFFYADKKVSRVNAFNAGLDVYMNRAVEYIIENSPEYKGKDFKRIGVSVGHELFIGKVGLLTQLGYHIYSPYPAFSDLYQKFGFKYYISDIFFVAFNTRIFKLEISDETTFGLGMRL